AWHELMGLIRGSAYHSLGWTANRSGSQVARAGIAYLWGQGEPGVCCPASMSFASIAALRHAPEQLVKFRDGILSDRHDPRPLPPGRKEALTVGMAMTEKQGGSDLRQTQTTAKSVGQGRWEITGHKWFFSVPTSDLFLTLARTEAGISCFLAQGWRDDGSRNRLALQRLKDKCGNRSNASSEVEFHRLEAVLVGEEGRGIATILEMAHLTRLECAIGAAALMRHAVTLTAHHAAHRSAFQRLLVDQPVMRNVIADMALEAEAAMWLAMRAAWAVDRAPHDAGEAALARVIVPVAKYFICKRAPGLVAEALECHGGNGFIEENPIARLYREAPLNGLWEGAGNVICLDVIRALSRAPDGAGAFLGEIRQARGADPGLDALAAGLEDALARPQAMEGVARRLVERMALALSASLLVRFAPTPVAEAFRARLGGGGSAYGTLPEGSDLSFLIRRAQVAGSA
ncbi:MAG TPA: acyl-CoA dehydrogenase family protein, partial [Acetobacteraceae bacterium]|nr:acyl-CoA dehydrogenase family protein [Acetobacteraceae bacterium]